MKNNYDKIAPYYDRMSRLVFGRAQVNAQLGLLEHIKPGSSILIAGGGTGWILEALAKKYPESLHITYIEISGAMLDISRKKNYGRNKVEFIHLAIEDFTTQQLNDTIITPFLFDNFSAERATKTFILLNNLLRKGGNWLFTDFTYNQTAPLWQRLLLRMMYLFFHAVSHVEASSLPDMETLFIKHSYVPASRSAWYAGFIQAIAYYKESRP